MFVFEPVSFAVASEIMLSHQLIVCLTGGEEETVRFEFSLNSAAAVGTFFVVVQRADWKIFERVI